MSGDFRADRLPPYPLGELTESVRIARLSGQDIIDFSQINPDIGAPSPAIDKAIQSLLLPHHHRYSSSAGILSLRRRFARFYLDRFGVELDPDSEVLVTMGVKEGLGHLLLSMVGAGDQVMTLTPSYPVHPAAVFLCGATSIPVSLYESWEEADKLGYRLTDTSDSFFKRLQQLYEHTWPRPRAFVISFPHNPTTTTVTGSFFERLVDFAQSTGIYLLHDFAQGEIYSSKEDAPSLLSVKGAKACGVEFYSFSKSFHMPGWRIGFAVGNERLITALKRVKSYLDFGVFQPLQLGAQAALEKSLNTIEESRTLYMDRREVLSDGLTRLGWQVAPGRGSVFVWAKLPEASLSGGALAFSKLAVNEVGVAISPGSGFDQGANQFCRFGLGESELRTREGIKRLEKFG